MGDDVVEAGDAVEAGVDNEDDDVVLADDELEDVTGVLAGAVMVAVDDAVDVGEGSGVGEAGVSVEDAVGELDTGDGSAPARLMPDTDSVIADAITDIRTVVRFIGFSPPLVASGRSTHPTCKTHGAD